MIDLSTAVAVTKVTFLKCSKSEILRKNMNKYRKLLEKVKLKKNSSYYYGNPLFYYYKQNSEHFFQLF